MLALLSLLVFFHSLIRYLLRICSMLEVSVLEAPLFSLYILALGHIISHCLNCRFHADEPRFVYLAQTILLNSSTCRSFPPDYLGDILNQACPKLNLSSFPQNCSSQITSYHPSLLISPKSLGPIDFYL